MSVPATDARSALDIARAVIDQQEALIQTCSAEYSCDIHGQLITVTAAAKPFHQQQRYREQRRGKQFRFASEVVSNALVSKESDSLLRAYDGEKFRTYDAVNEAGG